MPRSADPKKIRQARLLEESGLSRTEIAERMRVTLRTVSAWLGPLEPGRPRLAAGSGSRMTRWRQAQRHAADSQPQPQPAPPARPSALGPGGST